MAFVFPNSPTVGEEANGYFWDGQKWTKDISSGGGGPSNALPLADGDAAAGDDPEYSRADHVHPYVADAAKLNVAGGQTTTGGFRFTPFNAGTLTAGQTFTPNALNGNYQTYINNGAHNFQAPANGSAVDVLMVNGPTAGAITFTGGWYAGTHGDALTTTNGHAFLISVRNFTAQPMFVIKALQ